MNMKTNIKVTLLDVMDGDKFVCQLKYYGRGFPVLVDGEIIEEFRQEDLLSFVYEKRPSLKNKKNISVQISGQRMGERR